jgi:predicted nucleic acid-binding protein
MGAYFLDTSALVKRYVAETGTPWVQNLVDPRSGNRLYVVTIAAVELTSATVKRERVGSLAASQRATVLSDFRTDYAHQYRKVDVSQLLIDEAMVLAERHVLRAYDAVQLAAAVRTNRERVAQQLDPLTLVSADDDLNTAARAEGLTVEDPNAHP